MRSGGARHRIRIGSAARFQTSGLVRSYQWTSVGAFPRLICSSYAAPSGDVSNSYVVVASYPARRETMLDLALFFGFALLCVYIAYERLCNRW